LLSFAIFDKKRSKNSNIDVKWARAYVLMKRFGFAAIALTVV